MLNQQPYISGNIVLDEIAKELHRQPLVMILSSPPCRNFAYDYAVKQGLINPDGEHE